MIKEYNTYINKTEMTDDDRLMATFILRVVYGAEGVIFVGDLATFNHKGEEHNVLVQRVAQDDDAFLFNTATMQGTHGYVMQMSDVYIRMFSLKKMRELLEQNIEHIKPSGTNRQVPYNIVKGITTQWLWEEIKKK